jgi:hypothetical protein
MSGCVGAHAAVSNLEIPDHFPEIKDAMVANDWDYMAHGLYNSRPINDCKRRAGAGLPAGLHQPPEGDDWQASERTAGRRCRIHGQNGRILMAEAGCPCHTSWIIDDQPWPINVRGGQKFIYVPYTDQTNDASMLSWDREADYFQ